MLRKNPAQLHMHRLLLLGLNHTTAPLDVRERLAFNATQRSAVMAGLRQRFPGCEAVILSTCNRVEVYVARPDGAEPTAADLISYLADFHAVPPESVKPHLYEKTGTPAVEHLFAVASSLDSMVLGETQILGQVRDAYDAASAVSATGPMLNPLFQRAVAVGKQVMHETALAEGRLSVASVAVDFARQIFDHFGDKSVLCIGAGKMAYLVLQSFAALSPRQLLICNRDPGKAAELATRFRGTPVPFEQLNDALAGVDIVITSTGSARPIITAAAFAAAHRKRRYRPIFLIDIALPRDIEPAVGELENVYLYNVDDLQQVVSKTQVGRRVAIESARKIVDTAVADYLRAHRARALGPVIDSLYKKYHAIADAELVRTLGKLPNISESEQQHLQELARRLVNKLLNDPVQALRHADQLHGPAGQYVHAMEQLFRLNAPARESRGIDDDSADPSV